jgi:hypothetical protein
MTEGGGVDHLVQARVGSTLRGKYRLDSVLGIGGMAAVYRATDRNQAEFAIKMLHPALSMHKDVRQRFLREGYVAKASRPLVLLACLMLASAPALADTMTDCIEANEKSIELRKQLKLVEARVETSKCASSACSAEVRRICADRAARLTLAIPSIVFDVKDGAGRDLTGVRVTVDGAPAQTDPTVAAIALDPGPHEFVFEAAGQRVQRSFVLREGESQRHEPIVVGSAPARVALGAASSPSGPVPDAFAQPDAGGGNPMRTTGIVVGSLGVAGIAVGAAFGALAASSWSNSQNECRTATSCPQPSQAQSDHDSAVTSATGSTIGFVTGGALLALGGVLLIVAPRHSGQAGQRGFAPGWAVDLLRRERRGGKGWLLARCLGNACHLLGVEHDVVVVPIDDGRAAPRVKSESEEVEATDDVAVVSVQNAPRRTSGRRVVDVLRVKKVYLGASPSARPSSGERTTSTSDACSRR